MHVPYSTEGEHDIAYYSSYIIKSFSKFGCLVLECILESIALYYANVKT